MFVCSKGKVHTYLHNCCLSLLSAGGSTIQTHDILMGHPQPLLRSFQITIQFRPNKCVVPGAMNLTIMSPPHKHFQHDMRFNLSYVTTEPPITILYCLTKKSFRYLCKVYDIVRGSNIFWGLFTSCWIIKAPQVS